MERRIVYWSKPAVRITGWHEEDVIGKHCFDDILCHIDKDGHKLCGSEFCPFTERWSPIVKQGIPTRICLGFKGAANTHGSFVAPYVTVPERLSAVLKPFRDASAIASDMERAKAIQKMAMDEDIPKDVGLLSLHTTYRLSIVGGDYYSIKDIGDGRYALMVADVAGMVSRRHFIRCI